MKQYRGSELKDMREQAGLNGPAVAKLLGVGYKTYWAWESDQNAITDLAWETIKSRISAERKDNV